MSQPLVLFGSAEIAELAKFYFDNDSNYQVVGFTVDDEFVEADQFQGLPLVPFSEVAQRFPPEDCSMHVALSYAKLNQLREQKYKQAKAAGYQLPSYVCSKSVIWPDLKIGDNCFILENQTVQPTVEIGNNVMVWSGNHIGHGSVIGDHSYIASHVVISGHSRIGKRCFLGVNATIKDFTTIGDDCFVAMDASVNKDMANGAVALGASAEIFTEDNRRARALKRTYFRV
ncbi:acetyltransferase [Kiloniella sp.]|uniref:acetyltransferase n=1 Tax=Kiloniella sp. TaxID=1938587 RepID=UPI003B01C1AB